jgi:glucosamine 6-phosphate synthetase-like amidotransferase/phosphosugar isomerase protein
MIYNHDIFPRKYSTCDSEVIAHLYETNKVGHSISKLSEFTEKMEGWFTVLALLKDDGGKMVMDAFSDSSRLGSYFIKELNTRVYSTYADDVAKVAKALGLTPVDMEQIKPDTAFRLDVLTGEQIEFSEIKTSANVPVTVYSEADWEGWANISTMEGNMSDDAFRQRFFSGGFRR